MFVFELGKGGKVNVGCLWTLTRSTELVLIFHAYICYLPRISMF